ncbi:MAG TPA: hypothetical protein VG843_06850 [Rhizomicrobium sp.]|jgi:hypothetical protein|nr:hypothetical protein [Rhizomicrobium sp.]
MAQSQSEDRVDGAEDVLSPVEIAAPDAKTLFEALRDRDSGPPRAAVEFHHVEQQLRERVKRRHERFRVPWRRLALLPPVLLGALVLFVPGYADRTEQWLLYGMIAVSLCVSFYWGRWRAGDE